MTESDISSGAEQAASIREAQAANEGDGFDFIPGGVIAAETKNRLWIADGKTVIELGSPEARTALVIDKDSIIDTGEDGVTRSSRITAEIHSDDTDIIIGEAGMLLVVVGDGLANKKKATNPDGSVRAGEFVGDGVINGHIEVVRPGDRMLVHRGKAHVHGTLPGSIAAATFVKRREIPQS